MSPYRFEADNDYEAYCYLKYALAPQYQVFAHPSTEYFSEWHFHYEVVQAGRSVATLCGDFREMEPGALAMRARELVRQLTRDESHANRQ